MRKFANEIVVIEKGEEKNKQKRFEIDQRLTRKKIHLLFSLKMKMYFSVKVQKVVAQSGGGIATAAAVVVQFLVEGSLSTVCLPLRADDSARTLGSSVCTCEVGETCRTWPSCWRRSLASSDIF